MAWDDVKNTGDKLTAAEYNAMTADQILRLLKSLFDTNTILKADSDDTPVALTIAEQRILGRITAGSITGLTAAQVRTLCDVPSTSEAVLDTLFDAYSILYADTDNTPAALTIAASRLVGRKAAGGIAAMTIAEAKTLLAIGIADISDIPGTIASILTDHDKAAHDALSIDAATLDSLDSLDFIKKDGTVAMTGDFDAGTHSLKAKKIMRDADNDYFAVTGGSGSYEPIITLFGKNHATHAGIITISVPNAAKNALLEVFAIFGATDTPTLKAYYNLIIDTIKTDEIIEKTADAGVTIDTCLIKDGKAADADKIDGIEGAELFKKDGTVAMTGDFDIGAHSIKNIGTHNLGFIPDCSTALKIVLTDGATLGGWVCDYLEVTGPNSFITVNSIRKKVTASGITIDGELKEYIIDSGVTVDGCLIKDGYPHIPNHTPSAANDTGTAGQICYDASYIYMCVATDTWKRVAIATW